MGCMEQQHAVRRSTVYLLPVLPAMSKALHSERALLRGTPCYPILMDAIACPELFLLGSQGKWCWTSYSDLGLYSLVLPPCLSCPSA